MLILKQSLPQIYTTDVCAIDVCINQVHSNCLNLDGRTNLVVVIWQRVLGRGVGRRSAEGLYYWRWTASKEGSTGIINLPHDDPDIVVCLLEGLYEFKYSAHSPTAFPIPFKSGKTAAQTVKQVSGWAIVWPRLLVNAKVYALAEKYDISRVQEISIQQTKALVDKSPGTIREDGAVCMHLREWETYEPQNRHSRRE